MNKLATEVSSDSHHSIYKRNNDHWFCTTFRQNQLCPLCRELRKCSKGHANAHEDEKRCAHCYKIAFHRCNFLVFWLWKYLSIKQVGIYYRGDHDDPNLCLPSELHFCHQK